MSDANVKQSVAGRIKQLETLIAAEEISEANGATPQYDENGRVKQDIVTCGNCGKSWNDALITDRTPAPSARCPYEYIHAEIAELARLRVERCKYRHEWVKLDEKEPTKIVCRKCTASPNAKEWKEAEAMSR